jgi:Asp-tRNA(Asn)/Glu-tRNA(Gln) amidotransferase A subunit family amidase
MYIESQTRPLVVGVMRDDGLVRPHPAVARVLDETVKLLQDAGHEIVPWNPSTIHQECIDIMVWVSPFSVIGWQTDPK